MAEVTWRATLVGALVLFLIGLVVATCFNYTKACLTSIDAGLRGPYSCSFQTRYDRKRICNDTGDYALQDCIYVFVEFENPSTAVRTEHIKLSYTYLEARNASNQDNRVEYSEDGSERPLGKCSADFCGEHRFTDENGNYRKLPKLVVEVDKALNSTNGTMPCFLNPDRPAEGAYLQLNDIVKAPERRIFRYYEAWIILVAPFAVLAAILLSLLILFIRGDLVASPIQKPKETFIPPGFQPTSGSTSASAQGSIRSVQRNQPPPAEV